MNSYHAGYYAASICFTSSVNAIEYGNKQLGEHADPVVLTLEKLGEPESSQNYINNELKLSDEQRKQFVNGWNAFVKSKR